MKVRDLVETLYEYNPDADVSVIVNNKLQNDLSLSYGSSDGCTKQNCEDVYIEIGNNTADFEL